MLIASQGEALTDAECEIFRELTGGSEHGPDRPCKELVAVCGRCAGKTRAMAVAAAYFARCIDYTDDLPRYAQALSHTASSPHMIEPECLTAPQIRGRKSADD